MNIVQERKYADRVAGGIRGFINDGHEPPERIATLMLGAMGSLSLPIDLIWQMARAPFATGPDGWADRHHDAFWDVLERMESAESPGIVRGSN